MKKLKLFAFSLIAFLCFGVISVNAFSKTVITIDGLTYTSRDYDTTPISPSGILTHEGYTGTINILYEGIEGTVYSSAVAPTNAGSYKVTYSIPYDDSIYAGSKVYTFDIFKADPIAPIPEGLFGYVQDMLSTVSLPDRYAWFSSSTEIAAGGPNNYKASYCPVDTDNYNCISDVMIPVYGKKKYDIITSVDGGNGRISNWISPAYEGNDYEVTFTPAVGYMIDTVIVNEAPITITSNTYNIDNIDKNYNIVVSYKKIEYEVTNGAGQKHIIGNNEDATFKIDADKDLFQNVYLNDEELNSEFYTITEGSTIITLKQDFLNNLLPNTYNLRATFTDGGEANTTFVIAAPAESNPQTGDPIMLSIILGSISIISLLGAILYFKNKNA